MINFISLFLMSCGHGTEPPDIYDVSPTNGVVGTTVTINGIGFDPNTANDSVKFNGTAALLSSVTDTEIVVTVPAGATTGSISVTVNGQTATSTGNFTVLPTITGFSPTSGSIGGTVTIEGTGFDPNSANDIVGFNGTTARVSSVTDTEIIATVPAGATTGSVSVTVNGQEATSSLGFTVN